MNVDNELIKRYHELYTIQKVTLPTESEMEEFIEISTKILYKILEEEDNKAVLNRLRNR